MKKLNLQTGIISIIILLAAFTRIMPHPPNFSPMAAIGLFGAAHFAKKWQAFLIPLIGIWISDLVINNFVYSSHSSNFVWFYGGFYWQYISYVFIIFAGLFIFNKGISVTNTLGGMVSSSGIFFLFSNFGVWAGGAMYTKNISGLITCYAAGIPFIHNTIISDALFTTVLFGTYYLLQTEYSYLKLKHLRYS
ncbi:MAG: DUF6580 family putative transport protein [Candidatus Neomarinimicrobiota bacterium]|jgi:hypothetical protein|nr:hypothetical protein [Candidatus Neomarinimicrobiota bacterium]MEC7855993.1 DUF6580 family putative transport protein [Candidatus Neomarinimicrobiota bacterium]|tara:strand:- start:1345 stop:1920 length:576 start_codon:yes stop_codon:yes gene_type:complete